MNCCTRRSKANILAILYGYAKVSKGIVEIHSKYPDVRTQAGSDRNSFNLPILLRAIRRIENGEEPNKVLHETLEVMI